MLSFNVKKCNNATSEVVCASFGENNEHLKQYLSQFNIHLQSLMSYIDYGADVEPFIGPVRNSYQLIESVRLSELNLNMRQSLTYSLVEH